MNITVRVGSPADSQTLQAHQAAADHESAGYRGHLDVIQPTSAALVEFDGTPVGSVAWTDNGHVRTVTRLHVLPDFRGIGAGDALMEWLLADCIRCGITTLRGSALPGDRQTKNIFERHGLVARAIQVERRLD